uniref:Bisphosphate nucleotidase n=1 Tax=Panagrolaimus sp. JU765 TaxID=591449 RepID=A0AC34RDP8_9BILA
MSFQLSTFHSQKFRILKLIWKKKNVQIFKSIVMGSETQEINLEDENMWQKACCVTRLVASSVRVSETAGNLIKSIMTGGDLKIIDKSDNGQADLQTEADRSAQFCIERSLQEKFQNKLKIIGEEEVTSKVPNKELSFSKQVLELDSKLPEEYRGIKEEDVVIWVDPLDGTSEFAAANKNKTSNLQQVTVLIGICYQGRAIAGVVHQPYYSETSGRTLWGIVGVGAFGLDVAPASKERVVVTTRSHSTQLVQSALQSLEKKQLVDRVEKISGAGYKVLKCLEGAAAYVFASDGCKKWDTAAPEALLIAAGGMLTDISGRRINYNAGVQFPNTGGVLATAKWVNHQDYVDAIPDDVKNQLKEFAAKK